MGMETFKINIASAQQAEHMLLLLRQRISDAVIYVKPQGAAHICHIQTNRDVTDVARALFIQEGIDCQKL
jgi:hypothetical protein